MAAVKPIELVLRDFKTRLTEFEKYSEGNYSPLCGSLTQV